MARHHLARCAGARPLHAEAEFLPAQARAAAPPRGMHRALWRGPEKAAQEDQRPQQEEQQRTPAQRQAGQAQAAAHATGPHAYARATTRTAATGPSQSATPAPAPAWPRHQSPPAQSRMNPPPTTPHRAAAPSARIVVPPFSSFEALAEKEGGISVHADTPRSRAAQPRNTRRAPRSRLKPVLQYGPEHAPCSSSYSNSSSILPPQPHPAIRECRMRTRLSTTLRFSTTP